MFNKDTFRLIRKSFNRFLSLFMIVLVSSSFMMGLFSNGTILRESMDIYNDEVKALLDRFRAVGDASRSYKTFSGLADGMDGNVKFVYTIDGTTED